LKSNLSYVGRFAAAIRSPFRPPRDQLDRLDYFSGLGDSAYLLFGLARALKPQTVVEIGSARGKSACFLGMALKENGSGKLYAIDPHAPTAWNDLESTDTIEEMRRNISALGLEEIVEIVRMTSGEAVKSWTRPIDLLFIDGDHSFAGVKSDWDSFSPFVIEFGVVVFHDTMWDRQPDKRFQRPDMGVPAFVESLRAEGYPVITLDKDHGVSVVQPRRGGVSLAPSFASAVE